MLHTGKGCNLERLELKRSGSLGMRLTTTDNFIGRMMKFGFLLHLMLMLMVTINNSVSEGESSVTLSV